MRRMMLVSSAERGLELIAEELNAIGPIEWIFAHNAREARAALEGSAPELVLINAPLSDAPGDDLAEWVARRADAGVLLLSALDSGSQQAEALMLRGICLIKKPVVRALLLQGVRHALAARARLTAAQSERSQLKQKLDEVRAVNRAKATLMSVLNMTEVQAHRYIEKQAMDLRTTRMEVAQNILKNYRL